VDETSITRGHEYITVVNALSEARVLDVIDERKEESLSSFWSQYSPDELARVERVAMDMWPPYIASTRKHLTIADEKIVFDKFHIMKHLGDAVDLVRRAENRQLQAVGDERLAKTRYLWLTHPERLEGEARARIDALRGGSLKTARAFRLQRARLEALGLHPPRNGRTPLAAVASWSLRCALEPIRVVARMIRSHWDGVINAATSDITNAMSESVNSHIQRIKKRACGFRSRPRFREAILFHLGGLDLYPVLPSSIHTKA
jgi:transposase